MNPTSVASKPNQRLRGLIYFPDGNPIPSQVHYLRSFSDLLLLEFPFYCTLPPSTSLQTTKYFYRHWKIISTDSSLVIVKSTNNRLAIRTLFIQTVEAFIFLQKKRAAKGARQTLQKLIWQKYFIEKVEKRVEKYIHSYKCFISILYINNDFYNYIPHIAVVMLLQSTRNWN